MKNIDILDYEKFERQLVTFETVPSVAGGLLPDIHKSGLDVKQSFNDLVLETIKSDLDTDVFVDAINMGYDSQLDKRFGTFEGNRSATNIFQMAEDFGENNLISNEDVDCYCAMIGIAFEQDAVPYMRGVAPSKEAEDKHFGLQLSFEDSIDQGRFIKLTELFESLAQGVEFTVVGEKEVRAVNFRGDDGVPFSMSDPEFVQKVLSVVEAFPSNESVGVERMRVEGNYIFNDWEQDKEGQGYCQLLEQHGRGDLIEVAYQVRDKFMEKVNDFAFKNQQKTKTLERHAEDNGYDMQMIG